MKKIFWRVGVYFAVALIVLTAVTGIVFTRFNRRNITNVYKGEMKSLAKSVSEQVSEAIVGNSSGDFFTYLSALEDFGELRDTDIWILANPSAESPLGEEYTNIDMNRVSFQEKNMRALLSAAFNGKTKSYSGYDSIYDADMMHIATPVKDAKGDNVGAVLVNGEMSYRQNSVLQYEKYMLVSVVVALLFSLVIAAFFSRQLVRPIIRIKEIALRMAEGEYAQKTKIHRKDELGMLADSMDILSEKLVEAEEFHETLDQSRRDFFSNVSHELRTPITVVKGYAETLMDGYVDDAGKQREYFDRIIRECVGMERLVSDLLILSKMQNPDFELDKEVLNVIAVMQDAMRSMRVLMGEKDIEGVLDYEDECSLIDGDYDRIRQLFLVLLQNAVKYADEGTEIKVNITRQEGKILVSVEDTGVAVPRAEWENIFEKFYRGNNHGNKDGSGLGLMVARHIVNRHSGRVWVTSDEKRMTCFYVELPEYSRESNLGGRNL